MTKFKKQKKKSDNTLKFEDYKHCLEATRLESKKKTARKK